MTKSGEIAVVYHGHTFLELAGAGSTVFLDPVFSSARRGRRQRGETRKADYVFVSRESDVLEDALDVLEDSDAILVASDGICRYATQELDLGRGRTRDLEPWERANDEAFRVTAVPLTAPSLVDDGTALLDGLTGGLGEGVSAAFCAKLFDITPDLQIAPALATGYTWSDDRLALIIKLRSNQRGEIDRLDKVIAQAKEAGTSAEVIAQLDDLRGRMEAEIAD